MAKAAQMERDVQVIVLIYGLSSELAKLLLASPIFLHFKVGFNS